MRMLFRLIIFVLILLTSCSHNPNLGYKNNKLPVEKRSYFYSDTNHSEILRKIQKTPDRVLNYLKKIDYNYSYSSYSPDDKEKALFSSYYEMLPDKLKRSVQKHVIAIYFIENFMGGGMTDIVYDERLQPCCILYLNPEILRRNLAEWITFRDNSTFYSDDGSIQIESRSSMHYYGLIHVLFHESCHVYDYIYGITPYVEPSLKSDKSNIESNDFVNGVWLDYGKTVPAYEFKGRNNFSSYGLGSKIPISQAYEIYSGLSKAPFASLYGSKNWAEDFAESFTWLFLKQKYNIDYSVLIKNNDKILLDYKPMSNTKLLQRNVLKLFERLSVSLI